MPVAVSLSFPAVSVAGPDCTVTVTGKPELALGTTTAKGATPRFLVGIVAKGAMVCEPMFTVKLEVTWGAALTFLLPA